MGGVRNASAPRRANSEGRRTNFSDPLFARIPTIPQARPHLLRGKCDSVGVYLSFGFLGSALPEGVLKYLKLKCAKSSSEYFSFSVQKTLPVPLTGRLGFTVVTFGVDSEVSSTTRTLANDRRKAFVCEVSCKPIGQYRRTGHSVPSGDEVPQKVSTSPDSLGGGTWPGFKVETALSLTFLRVGMGRLAYLFSGFG